jgi:hypothetical protein
MQGRAILANFYARPLHEILRDICDVRRRAKIDGLQKAIRAKRDDISISARARLYERLRHNLLADFRGKINDVSRGDIEINIDSLQEFQGLRFPALKLPEFFMGDLGGDVLNTIIQSPLLQGRESMTSSIFDRSCFSDDDFRFQSKFNGTSSVIFGAKQNTWRALAGIAHELGHCLTENNFGHTGLAAQLRSEYFAQVLEEYLVLTELRRRKMHVEARQWIEYQRDVDKLNFYFAMREYEEISRNLVLVNRIVSEPAEALRETFYQQAGYQLVYGFASLGRWPGMAARKLGVIAFEGPRYRNRA